MKTRTCKECGDSIVGRSDKKFCSDYCRNVFNNRRNREKKAVFRRVNRVLQSNYNILSMYCQPGGVTTTTQELARNGFNFQFFTRAEEQNGQRTVFCYDIKYSIVDQEKVYLERFDRFQRL